MTVKIELQLDEQVLHQAQRLADARSSSVEAIITEIVERGVSQALDDPWLGMFADEPQLMDEVVSSALAARETDPLRAASG